MASSASKPTIRRTILAAGIAVAGAIAVGAPAGAAAAVDGTSNTIMFAASPIEPHGQVAAGKVKFMDYTDDTCALEMTARLHEEEGIHYLARAVAAGRTRA